MPLSIAGTVSGQAINDDETIDPFVDVTIADDPSAVDTVTVTLSNPANGTLSALSGGTYNYTTGVYQISGSANTVTAALDALIFTPTQFEVLPGQTVTTDFTISVTDGEGGSASNANTSVITTAVIAPVIADDVMPIVRIYETFLDRAPDPGGLSTWVSNFESGTETLSQIALAFASSPEFEAGYGTITTATAFVTALYANVLGRAPDPTGLATWVDFINASGGMTTANEATVALAFAQSAEYIDDSTIPIENWLAQENATGTYATTISGLPNSASSEFVTQLYDQALLRGPSPAELISWITAINSGADTEAQVAVDVASSSEALNDVLPIVRLYEGLLVRAPDPGGLSNYVNILRDGTATLSQIAAAFVASPEFATDYGTNLTPTAFVTELYHNVLNRAPDPGGLTTWVDAINSLGGMTVANEATVALDFTQSAEYQNDSTLSRPGSPMRA